MPWGGQKVSGGREAGGVRGESIELPASLSRVGLIGRDRVARR